MTDTVTTLFDAIVPAQAPFSTLVRAGHTIRIEDSHGCQAVDTLFYRADDLGERYSSQDTVRAQGAAYVTTGTRVMSNEGRVMLTVTADSCGRHDTSAGACSCESNTVRFGHATKYLHACRENFALEVAKYGLSKRDIECLRLTADGLTSEQIAERLGLSVHTANQYVAAAAEKLDAVNRMHAVAKALRAGIIS